MVDRAPPFVVKLRILLDNPRYHHAICWNDLGTIVLVNKVAFAALILGQVFKSTKFKSFVRQMNLHGFRQITRPANSHIQGFGCPNFVKHDKDGVRQACMERKAAKATDIQEERFTGEAEEEDKDGFSHDHLERGLPAELLLHDSSCALRQAAVLALGLGIPNDILENCPGYARSNHLTVSDTEVSGNGWPGCQHPMEQWLK